MMTRLQLLFPALISFMLLAAAGSSFAQNIDCRSCHVPGSKSGAADFSKVYANVASHHPVDINYPLGLGAEQYFNQPDMQHDDVTFFDKNDNGQPDSDEIQLFSMNGAAQITCSTCHRNHGASRLPANAPRDAYLRVTIVGSKLCSTCHSQ
ncbi:MAG: hypothetical protein ACOY9D_12445 [Pseudomonadota bacterium]